MVAALPSTWHEGALRAAFPDEVGTDLEVWYRASPGASDTWVEIPTAVVRDFVGAARALRAELVNAGSPECSSFVFRLSHTGKSSLDVEY